MPQGEAVAIAIGFSDLLRKEPRRILGRDIDEVESVPRRVREACRAFLAEDAFQGSAPALDHIKYETALEQLHTPDDVHHIEAVHVAFRDHHELADAYLAVADAAVAHMLPLLPTRSVQTMTELRQIQPSRQEYARFLRVWTVLNRPMTLLEQLSAGALASNAVEAIVAVFPAFYEMIKSELFLALAARKKEKASYVIPMAKDRELCRLLQKPIVPGTLAKEMQAAFGKAADKVPAPGSTSSPAKSATDYQTPTTKAEDR